jgi:hypothetical protein
MQWPLICARQLDGGIPVDVRHRCAHRQRLIERSGIRGGYLYRVAVIDVAVQQLARGQVGDDATIVHHRYAVAHVLSHRELLGRKQYRLALVARQSHHPLLRGLECS